MYVHLSDMSLFYKQNNQQTATSPGAARNVAKYMGNLETLAEVLDLSLQACLAGLQLCLLTHQREVGSPHSVYL